MAFNSLIADKYSLCVDCKDGIEKPTIAGRCKAYHYSIYRKLKIIEKQKEKNKFRSLQHLPQNKVMLIDNGIKKNTDLELWFRMQMQANDKYCQNCGKSLYHYNDNDWRGSQHHIIDKSPLNGCPSVATHPLNHLVLGKWCCHSQWHTSFENASKMPVFSKAQEKFLLFERFIAPDELKKVNPYLFQT